MNIFSGSRARILSLAIVSAIAQCSWATAQDNDALAAFYRNKNIDIYIGYSAGGSYDAYARIVGRFIGNHIPGQPRVVMRQMAGGGSRIAANHVFNIAPRDGTVMATADQAMPVQQAVGDPDIKFDTSRLNWIGNPTADNNLLVVWHTSGVHTLDDIKKKEVVIASTGINTSSQYAQALNSIAGARFKIVLGYPGAAEMGLAMERGEVMSHTAPWAAWKANRPDWVRDKKINIIFQVGLTRSRELPDVPLFMDYAQNDLDRAALRLFSAAATIGRPLFSTPDTPPERVDALRRAFDLTMQDRSFLDAAAKTGLDIEPVSGLELQRIVNDIVNTPKEVTARLAAIIALPDQKKN
ncbi:MAG: tripartite tricarboxylate transporter substrate-binding protein [Beijerinckiaceae bacterium]|nr:tripartite tricarboxylate transporter substrate-binding protein [Beijerinckiaceae bacterium]